MESNHPNRICNPILVNSDKDLGSHRVDTALKKRSVLIVGLRGANETMMKREFGTELSLRFYDNVHAVSELGPKCRKVDAVIGMVDFMSHKHQSAIQAENANYIIISGGLTRLRDELKRQVAQS